MASITSKSTTSPSVSASSAVLSTSTILTSVNSTKDSDAQTDDSQTDDSQTIRFTKVQDLFNRIDHTSGDSLTVTNVSLYDFTKIERTREEQGRKFRFRDYDSDSQILIITIPTNLHEQLHKRLYNKCIRQFPEESWKDIGSSTYSARVHSGPSSSKEGDSTGGPEPERAAKGAWPTLVIESGVSQTLARLRMCMRRWFSMSNHEVKIVILTKFDGNKILVEKWEEEISVRTGATTTRRSATLQHPEPVLRQSIAITRDTTTNPATYNVTRGALVLSFRLLFLRDLGAGEGDLVYSVQDLEKYAEKVWVEV